jgi:hypothetical protein
VSKAAVSRAAVAALTGLLVSGHVGRALALAPDSEDAAASSSESREVNELLDRGITLRRSGDDARALELFRQAEKIAPESTRVQVHLAAAYQALGQWESADHYLSQAIRNPDDSYIQKHQSVLAAARRTIDAHIGQLQISGGPEGTDIRLNGRSVGTLPIRDTLRIEAGIYTLEARLSGHYPVTRSVALAGGTLVRESVLLTPEAERADGAVSPSEPAAVETSSGPRWLGWVFAGLSVGAGVGTVAAWATREAHVDNWNDDSQCLRPGTTRGEACASEREAGDQAETWMWISGAATGVFAAASVVTFAVTSPDAPREQGVSLGCGVGIGMLSCSGSF